MTLNIFQDNVHQSSSILERRYQKTFEMNSKRLNMLNVCYPQIQILPRLFHWNPRNCIISLVLSGHKTWRVRGMKRKALIVSESRVQMRISEPSWGEVHEAERSYIARTLIFLQLIKHKQSGRSLLSFSTIFLKTCIPCKGATEPIKLQNYWHIRSKEKNSCNQ